MRAAFVETVMQSAPMPARVLYACKARQISTAPRALCLPERQHMEQSGAATALCTCNLPDSC